MNRLETWTIALLLGTAVAIYDLVTRWTGNGSAAALIVVLGLFAGAIALFAAMLVAGVRDRTRIVMTSPDAMTVLTRAAHAIRWSGAFAVGFCILLFADCTGAISTTGPGPAGPPGPQGPALPPGAPGPVVHAPSDFLAAPSDFLSLTAWVLGPLVLALLLPPILATAAQLLATQRPHAARTLAQLAIWGSVLAAIASVATVPVGFYFGISACYFETSAGACAAGAGSFMNLLSLGSLVLFIPYIALVLRALGRVDAVRAT
jgi:hypothetical protein